MYYTYIACITIDSVVNVDKKKSSQVYLEECKYRIKKTQIPKFINTELKSASDSNLDLDSEVESKSDAKSVVKLEKSDSDSE